MDPATIVKLMLVGGIVLNVVSIGVRAKPGDALHLFRHPALAGRALFAMFVAVPAFVLALTLIFDLPRAVSAVLLALSVAPMPPLLSNKEVKAGGDTEYAIGLQVLATVASLVAVPLMLKIAGAAFGLALATDIVPVAKILLITVFAPMAAGMALGHFFPGLRDAVATWASRIGWAGIALGSVALIAARWSDIVARLGGGTLALTVLVIAFALFIGHALGGPDEGNRSALAITTAARHPGVAITIVSGLFPEEGGAILGMAGLFWLTSFAMAIPYLKWRKQSVGL
jgi:bile acid:Na+ symporter, BASS family